MCSYFNNLFTVTSNNNTMYSKNRIGNRNILSKLPIIVFQINSIIYAHYNRVLVVTKLVVSWSQL